MSFQQAGVYAGPHWSPPNCCLSAAPSGSAAVILSVAAVAVEGASVIAAGNGGVAGWLASPYWWLVVYLAIGPGIVGHTSFNALLKYLHPLAISLPLVMEPVHSTLPVHAADLGWQPPLVSMSP